MMEGLRLSAFDADDLAVISAHMQDAVIVLSDISYVKRERRFALIANRFVWESAASGKAQHFERRRTGLHFEGVQSVKAHRITLGVRDAVLSLLSIAFQSLEPPGGTVTLSFSGGGEIRLDVEFLEAWLRDLGPAWETPHLPSHDR
jgi:hypothetical protein